MSSLSSSSPGNLDTSTLSRPAPRPVVPARLARLAFALLLPVVIAGAWMLATHYELVAEQILPAPSVVADTVIDLVSSGQLQSELGVSAARLVCGLAAGAGLGLAFGLWLGASLKADAYLGPTLRAIMLVPSLGWLPLFMIAFGIGETLKFVLIAKTCFLPLMINSYAAVRNMPRKYRDVARVLELGRVDTLRYIVVPAILPAIFVGFRESLSKGWKALVLVEMIASAQGIGYLMTWGRKAFQMDVVIVTMIVIGLTGWVIDYGSLLLQRRFAGWAKVTA